MSNYPPPPYGALAPQVGSYNSGMAQQSYQQQNLSPYYYGPSQPNGVSPAPHANAHSFQVNAQDVRASLPSNGVNHGPTFAKYEQAPYNTLPPPPYPPVSIPYGAPSYAPHCSSQPLQSLHTASAHPFPPSHLLHSQQSTNDNPAVAKPLSPPQPELEDGEVDDTEPDKTVNRQEAASMGSIFSRSPGGEQNESEGSIIAATHSNQVTQPSRLTQDSRSEPKGYIAISSPQPQRPPMRNGIFDLSHDSPSSQLKDDLSKSQFFEMSIKARSEEPAVLINGKSQEARQALHDLHLKGYDFNQIVEKGLHPDILKELYTMIGIAVTPSPFVQPQQVIGPAVENTTMTDTSEVVASKNVNAQQPQQIKEASSAVNTSSNDKPFLQSKDTSYLNSLTPVTTAKDNKPSHSIHKSIKGVSGKTQATKASDSKVVDRKEYIARMLAAKTGKPALIASGAPKPITITDTDSPVQTKTSLAPSSIKTPTVQQAAQSTTDVGTDTPRQTNKEDFDVGVKRKAQTDLARQKIEALKVRESKQQEARIAAASSESDHQSRQPLSAHQTQSLFDSPVTAPRPTVPSRQGSYFSPTSQKPPFSIPGLFMTSDTLESAKPSQQMESQTFASSQQRANPTPPRGAPQANHSSNTHSPNLTSTMVEPFPLPGYMIDSGTSTLPSVRGTPTITHRKRQKAADFIDSPSTRVKRPLGEQEHSSVIIDISEDEADSLAGKSLDIDIDDGRNGLPSQLPSSDLTNEKQKSFRDLPPLTELPSRKKAALMTPPAAQVPGPAKDPEGLKSKEMAIEEMNRKIKEIEQRIAAKRTISRAQTPGASGSAAVSSPVRQSLHEVGDQPNAMTGVSRPIGQPTSPTTAKQPFLAIVNITESASEEQLIAQQRLQEAELAKAEAERSLAADAVRALEESQREEEETSEDLKRHKHKWLHKGQQRQEELQHGLQEAEKLRLNEEHGKQAQDEGSEIQEADVRLQVQQQQTLKEDEQRRLQEEQRRLRKTEIETDLPIIDATVERTRAKIEKLRNDMVDLGKELQKGVEDRKFLTEELYRLSQTTATLEMPVGPLPPALNVPAPQSSTSGEITQDPSKASAPAENISGLVFEQTSGATLVDQEPPAITQPVSAPLPHLRTVEETLSNGELEEDIMDISRSDIDEGEITESSPEAAAEAQGDLSMIDDEESYEPPSDIGANQQMLDQIQSNDKSEEVDLAMADVEPIGNSSPRNVSEVPHGVEEIFKDASVQHEEQSSHHSRSLADASDCDDYEPPEPSSFAEETAMPHPIPDHDSEASFSPLEAEPNDTAASIQSISQLGPPFDGKEETAAANSSEGIAHPSFRQIGQFTPYESPLKQFKAFRYHPKYLNEVSQGFRSLTYSNAINPETPICLYELGGTCNDDSCQSQHIKNMGLSDEKILVDLGATPNGLSPEDAEAFTNGLRGLIHDIRSRKIRDVNVVAQEISNHRAKFLGDPSKVLSL